MMKIIINYKATAPISHIGETASTGSYLQTIKTASGALPIITGNSIRGQPRKTPGWHIECDGIMSAQSHKSQYELTVGDETILIEPRRQ